MTIRLAENRRLPPDTRGERVLTPYGEIHVSARTLELWRNLENGGTGDGRDPVLQILGALLFDLAAGFISSALHNEILKRVNRVTRGRPAR